MPSAAIDLALKPSSLGRSYVCLVAGVTGSIVVSRFCAEPYIRHLPLSFQIFAFASFLSLCGFLVARLCRRQWASGESVKLSFRRGSWELRQGDDSGEPVRWQEVVILPFVVVFTFSGTGGFRKGRRYVCVWRDQLAENDWRRLRQVAVHASLNGGES